MPLIDSANQPGYVEIKMLFAMVLIKGLSRSNAATVNALRIHMQTYPGATSLDHADELIAEVLAMQDSDLATIGVTTNSLPESQDEPSAFVSQLTQVNTKSYSQPLGTHKPGKQHCVTCFSQTNRYYYGHTTAQCSRNLPSPSLPPTKALSAITTKSTLNVNRVIN